MLPICLKVWKAFQHGVPCYRAAIAPFLAAKEMGLESFKWVLYGDDDTVFFIDGALDALENLDYNMPYLLSDDVWFVEDDGETFNVLSPCLGELCSTLVAGVPFMFTMPVCGHTIHVHNGLFVFYLMLKNL